LGGKNTCKTQKNGEKQKKIEKTAKIKTKS
jgi:hypothetical protein